MPATLDEKFDAIIESLKKLADTQNSLVIQVSGLTSAVDKVRAQYTTLEQRVAKIEQQQTRSPPQQQQFPSYNNNDIDYNVRQRYVQNEEYQRRIDKQHNVVIENLPDDGADAVSYEGRSNPSANRELVDMKELVVSVGGKAEAVLGVFRMGEYLPGKNRPLKLKLGDSRTKRAFLRNQSKISALSVPGSKYKAWGRPDLTELQRNKWNSAKAKIYNVNSSYGSKTGSYLIKINEDCEFVVNYREFNPQSKRTVYSYCCPIDNIDHYLQSQHEPMESGSRN
jgi:hypothetical protein